MAAVFIGSRFHYTFSDENNVANVAETLNEDVLIAVCVQNDSGTSGSGPTVTAPDGSWAHIGTHNRGVYRISVFTKEATGTPGATTWTWSNSHWCWTVVAAYRNIEEPTSVSFGDAFANSVNTVSLSLEAEDLALVVGAGQAQGPGSFSSGVTSRQHIDEEIAHAIFGDSSTGTVKTYSTDNSSDTNLLSATIHLVGIEIEEELPDIPENLTLIPKHERIDTSWTGVPNATSYEIRYREEGEGSFTTISSISGSSYTITGLTNGKLYEVQVAGVNSEGHSGWSDSVFESPQTPEYWVCLYHAGWDQVDKPLRDDSFSHLIHFSVLPNSNGSLDTSTNSITPTNAQAAVDEAHAHGRKCLLAVGGHPGSEGFPGAASDTNRTTFINNLLDMLDTYGYDGIDLDWEFNGANDTNLDDNIALHEEIRDALVLRDQEEILTTTVFASYTAVAQNVWQFCDRIAFMSYTPYGLDSPHLSPIHEPDPSPGWHGIQRSVDEWLAIGVPSERMMFGLSFYCWVYYGVTEPYQIPTDTDFEIPLATHWSDMTDPNRRWDSDSRATWFQLSSPNRVISAEDDVSIADKAAYLDGNDLGGVIIWNHGLGWIDSNPEGEKDPLTISVRDHFGPIMVGAVQPVEPTFSFNAVAQSSTEILIKDYEVDEATSYNFRWREAVGEEEPENTWNEELVHTDLTLLLDNLNPDTDYEIQGAFTDSSGTSDWSESIFESTWAENEGFGGSTAQVNVVAEGSGTAPLNIIDASIVDIQVTTESESNLALISGATVAIEILTEGQGFEFTPGFGSSTSNIEVLTEGQGFVTFPPDAGVGASTVIVNIIALSPSPPYIVRRVIRTPAGKILRTVTGKRIVW